MRSKLAWSTTIGLAAGAFLGSLIGFASKDLALWLSIGVGAGMAFGVAIGALLDRKGK